MTTASENTTARRTALAATLLASLAVTGALLLPSMASASSSQISIMQDDATFVYGKGHDPEAAVAEAKALGVDAIRVFMSWHSVSPGQDSRERPAGFDVGNPNDPQYNWQLYDAFIDRARRHGIKVLLTLSPPIPFWASEQPGHCPHRIGGYANLTLSCMWKPSPALFAQFVKAVALRYGSRASGPFGGQVVLWSLYNEPNLEHYLYPQLQHSRFGTIDVAAARYRQLWTVGQKAIAKYDPPSASKVLFGDTAAISSPVDTIYGALCLDQDGRPFKGRLRALQGCGSPRKLPIAGLALHPYNKDAVGSVFQRSFTKDSLPMGYLGRAHKLLDRAARYGRIPRNRPIYVTEFGFQSSPPDRFGKALGLGRHAAAINEAEQLFYADPRIKSISQYELFDVEDRNDFNTGLRFFGGDPKPAWDAFRMPLVVTKLASNKVEIWGQVRPASGRVRPTVTITGGAPVGQPLTNASGYYRFRVTRRNAAKLRYRATWTSQASETLRSRVAAAGPPIAYRE